MKPLITAFAFILALAGSASAQSESDVAYQNSLRARALSAADKEFCVAKTGAESGKEFDACRITRLFLADINAGKDKGVPPLTEIKFARDKDERGKIIDRM